MLFEVLRNHSVELGLTDRMKRLNMRRALVLLSCERKDNDPDDACGAANPPLHRVQRERRKGTRARKRNAGLSTPERHGREPGALLSLLSRNRDRILYQGRRSAFVFSNSNKFSNK